MTEAPPLVHLVGAGPGDPDLLTVKALRLIQSADVVVYDRLVGDGILDLIPAGTTRISVGKESGHHLLPQDEINDLLVSLARPDRTVVRLKGGDPFVFGRGGEEALYLARYGVAVEVVPGITAAAGCAAMAGIPLTHRDVARSVRLITGHLSEDRALELDWDSLADPSCTLVIYMGVATIGRIAEGLMAAGLPPDTPVAVVERGTSGAARTLRSVLSAIGGAVEAWHIRPPALIIIGKVVGLGLAAETLSDDAFLPNVKPLISAE
ncbi:uroporphyrinogen-III C-methyltransferase [Paramagnetospirillum kuznetsovii]|uniref:uroporphyrinogen-III C-methyltransferase n=1 Tax=Paramagnetospirillum kuznetsovii TaxID=2053833 RepID=A0A364P257_9PROT|nr:uroporphyrinogen-III C-methyltransferase [Paramagnetospirillum kuznetsovii]RAU23403.1 uroporphyrinogen-III C-methyltransferase [Paramagnetospirillum kuznetsovii]